MHCTLLLAPAPAPVTASAMPHLVLPAYTCQQSGMRGGCQYASTTGGLTRQGHQANKCHQQLHVLRAGGRRS